MKKYSLLFLFFQLQPNITQDLTCHAFEILACPGDIKTALVPISQGLSLYLQYHNQLCEPTIFENNFFQLNVFYKYKQSYDDATIAERLFGQNAIYLANLPEQVIQKNWQPGYFGVSNNANVLYQINPSIQDQICNIEFFCGNTTGLWGQIDIPIVYSVWQMKSGMIKGFPGGLYIQNPGELYVATDNAGVISFGSSPEVMTPITSVEEANTFLNMIPGLSAELIDSTSLQTIPVGQVSQLNKYAVTNTGNLYTESLLNCSNGSLLTEANQFFKLQQPVVLPAKNAAIGLAGYTFGDLQNRLYNKIPLEGSRLSNTVWNIADVLLSCGYDKVIYDKHLLGIYAKCIVPTGNVLNKAWAEYVFTPIVGNGNRWQLGLGMNGFYEFCANDQYQLIFHSDVYITHMFGSTQWRSFDRLDRPLSRYVVLKEFNNMIQYNGNLVALGDVHANYFSISNAVLVEGVIDCLFKKNNSTWNLGYTLIFQSKEEAKINCAYQINNNYYGYKGITYEQQCLFNGIPVDGTTWTIDFVDIAIASNDQVVKESNITNLGNLVSVQNSNDYLFSVDSFEKNRSGLMNAQLLQKLFLKYDYSFKHIVGDPRIEIFGAYGFSCQTYYTPVSLEIGCAFSFVF